MELKRILTKQYLYEKYIVNKLSMRQIANELNISHCSVRDYLNKHKLLLRTKSQGQKVFIILYKNRKKSNHPRWNGGKPNCIDCGKTLSTYKAKRCISCYNKYNSKENHYNWKGGITPLVLQIRHCLQYIKWRTEVFKRDNYHCVKCGVNGTRKHSIEADHYPKTFSAIFKENNIKTINEAINTKDFWDINNGRTLCKKCHIKHGLKN